MKKTIAVVTATRAEYGLLKPLIGKLFTSGRYNVHLVVTGAHLSPEYGNTYQEIEADGFAIDEKIPILSGDDSPVGISQSMAAALSGFAEYFERKRPDFLVLLGDRYETLAIACAAMNARVPIAHLYGGETTEGAVDEACRHAITKMSWLHFTSTEEHRKRVIQLGEDPNRVFNVGALGVENATHIDFMTREELEESLGFALDKPFAIVTFHPVTLESGSAEGQIDELLTALSKRPDMKYIITGANADAGGRIIDQKVSAFVHDHENAISVESLGMRRYLSALHYAAMVIGNSSSGIVEAPSFHIPTVNIGDRQKGRCQAATVLNCIPETDSIVHAMDIALSEDFRDKCSMAVNPYGGENTSEQIVKYIDEVLASAVELKKKFYDVNFPVETNA